MKRHLVKILILGVIISIMISCKSEHNNYKKDDKKVLTPVKKVLNKTKVILATSTKGGGFEKYGIILAEVISQMDPSLEVVTQSTKGSKENLSLVESSKVDISLVEGNAGRKVFFNPEKKSTQLRILTVMYPNPGMFIVQGNSPYNTIKDLKGKKIAFGTRASGLIILSKNILNGMGLDMEKDFKAVYLKKASEGPKLVLAGKVDALWGGGIGWPGFVKVSKGKNGSRFIAPNDQEIDMILKKHPYFKKMIVPPNSYPHQKDPITSVGLWSYVLVSPNLSEEVVYRLAKAIHKGEGELSKRLLQASYTTAKNTALESPRKELIHKGVLKYLKEIGVIR